MIFKMIFNMIFNMIDRMLSIDNLDKLFTGISLGILLHDFFERRYPNEFEKFCFFIMNPLVNISYKCVYYYSKCQIFFMNIKNKFNLFVEATPILLKIRNHINNLNIYSSKFEKKIEYYDDYGFYIYNHIDNNIVNKLLFYKNGNDPINEKSDIKFMLIELKNGDNIYKIDLKTGTFNYYLIGNSFTKNFFIFYIKTHLNKKDELSDDNNYILKIIDHEINKIEIEFTDNNESILLEKNGYKLKNINHNEEKR